MVTFVMLTCANADGAAAVKRPSSMQNAKPATGPIGDGQPRLWGKLPITRGTVDVEIVVDRMATAFLKRLLPSQYVH